MSIDLVGERFFRLLVISPTKHRSGTSIVWECKCDCGVSCFVNGQNLRDGRQKSCGCWRKSLKASHGMSKTRIYRLWCAMLSRTKYKERYKNHAGRGISVCPAWRFFENFNADMGESYQDNLELDRVDVNGDYCKENCRWVDKSTQAFNKRPHKKNKSGRTGVFLHEASGKWDVKIGKDGKYLYLGRYTTFEEAVEVREAAEIEYFGFTKT